MWWMLAAQAAMGVLGGQANREITKINNRLSQVKADASNRVRLAGASKLAAESSLMRFTQSVNNQRVMASGGAALDAAVVNYQRHKDDAVKTSISDQIAAAEQSGAAAAMQAMTGAGGTAADMVTGATALRDSIVAQSLADREGMVDYDQRRRSESIMHQMVSGLDTSTIFTALDYGTDVAQRQAPSTVLGDALAGIGVQGFKAGAEKIGEYAQRGYDFFRSSQPATSRGANFKMDAPTNYWGI